MGEEIEFAAGARARGYLASPEGMRVASVLVLHPWWGLNDSVRSVVDRLAAEGFVALAPDMFSGRSAGTVEEAEALVQTVDDEESFAFAAGGLEELRSRSVPEGRDAIGVIALSYGAPFALRLSTERPEAISAVVLFYGTGGPADYRRARAAYLGHFAERDPYEDEESIGQLEAALRDAGREATFHRYPGTSHWFFEPDRPEYDAEAAELAWRRTIDFLRGAAPVRPG